MTLNRQHDNEGQFVEATDQLPEPRLISGRWVVLAMFAFGIFAGLLCVTYWKLHRAPFVELQRAVAAEFPNALPLVEGGTHKNSPMTLRFVLRVDYDPSDPGNSGKVQQTVDRLVELAREHHDVSRYKILTVHLVRREPEQKVIQKTINLQVADLLGIEANDPSP